MVDFLSRCYWVAYFERVLCHQFMSICVLFTYVLKLIFIFSVLYFSYSPLMSSILGPLYSCLSSIYRIYIRFQDYFHISPFYFVSLGQHCHIPGRPSLKTPKSKKISTKGLQAWIAANTTVVLIMALSWRFFSFDSFSFCNFSFFVCSCISIF